MSTRNGDRPAPGTASPAPVRLRPMTARHLRGVLCVERASSVRPWSPQVLTRELEQPASTRYLVALARSARGGRRREVVGFGGVQRRPDAAHVTNLAVAPEWRRRGIGGLLLSGLVDAAADLGAHAVTLEVRVGNEVARRLYERAGFTSAGVRPGYYRDPLEDAVIMWRQAGRLG